MSWTFSLYDINGDGRITREEMTDIVTSVYGLLGHSSDSIDEEKIKEKVERIFNVSDIFILCNFVLLSAVYGNEYL